jgi:hypothetical protein
MKLDVASLKKQGAQQSGLSSEVENLGSDKIRTDSALFSDAFGAFERRNVPRVMQRPGRLP